MRCCTQPGCHRLVPKGYCVKHAKQKVQTYDRNRGTSTQRGYDATWRRYREGFLEQHPFCGDRPGGAPATTDSVCAAKSLPVAASVVDHILPVTGADDPTFYAPTGHQALCASCHDAKRGRERRGGA